jgi:hypothetical protein
MQTYTPWFAAVAAVLVLVVAVAQWHIMSRRHLKRLAAERAGHRRAQQAAATQLQGAQQQSATLQRELAAARAALARRAAPGERDAPVDDGVAAREQLNKMLDEAPPPAMPVDGFADTQPSRQFAPSSTFGLLQRSTPRKG